MTEDKVVHIIKKRIDEADNGTLFFSNSFPEFDDEYVGHILSDLVADKILHRLCRGVYLKAEETRFGLVYPPIDHIAKAIAERDNAQILPTGATALNVLGLSTQVPMNSVFLTSGSARTIKLGERTVRFKRVVPKNFAIKGAKRSLIVQALKAIGENNVSEDEYNKISTLIKKYPEYETLADDLRLMPCWIRKFFAKTLNFQGNEYSLAKS